MRARLSSLAIVAVAALSSGCTHVRSHQGYVIDADLMNSIQPGVDNRESVLKTLGNPTFRTQFGDADWYYISRDTRSYAYTLPKPTKQLTIDISFDAAGNVSAVRRSGIEQLAQISPDRKETPTLGRKRTLLQDLFGNIGTVGAAGVGSGGAGGGGDNTGGGR